MTSSAATRRKRVLYFSTRSCWPVISGAQLRDFHLARQLSLESDLVYLGFSHDRNGGLTRSESLAELGDAPVVLVPRPPGYAPAAVFKGLLGPLPISVLNYTARAMVAELDRLLRQHDFDLIQLEGVHLSGYLRQLRASAPRAAIICDWHNIESELMARYVSNTSSLLRRVYAARTARLLRVAEQRLLDCCAVHTVCSEREQRQLQQRAPQASIAVINNGVDVGYFEPTSDTVSERRSVIFVGSMNYHANVDAALYFADEIWPAIRVHRPELRFVIVGSNPGAEVIALASRPAITVTGTVADIRPYYREALCVVVPLRIGGGTRLKVLEAMAAGAPVLSTTLGAEGLAVTDGRDIIYADQPRDFSNAVVAMAAYSASWRQLVANGRQLAASRYDWSQVGLALRQVHAQAFATVAQSP